MVTKLECIECSSNIEGRFTPCPVCTMNETHRELFDLFMASRGNLKEVQRLLGVSYPTARNRVNSMFEAYEHQADQTSLSRMEILYLLKEKKIDPEDAAQLLKNATR